MIVVTNKRLRNFFKGGREGRVNDLSSERRGMNRLADRRIWLKKSTRISDFEDTFCGLADFEQYFSADYEFCLFLSAERGN